MSLLRYFRRMGGVWCMRQSHVYLFNWRAWVVVFPIVAIGAAIILPIGAVLDLAQWLRGVIEDAMDRIEPHTQRMSAWALEKREQEWDAAHEKHTAGRVTFGPITRTEGNGESGQ